MVNQVEVPSFVTYYMNWRHACEWYVVWCSSNNGNHKYMCLIEIGLCPQKMSSQKCELNAMILQANLAMGYTNFIGIANQCRQPIYL